MQLLNGYYRYSRVPFSWRPALRFIVFKAIQKIAHNNCNSRAIISKSRGLQVNTAQVKQHNNRSISIFIAFTRRPSGGYVPLCRSKQRLKTINTFNCLGLVGGGVCGGVIKRVLTGREVVVCDRT